MEKELSDLAQRIYSAIANSSSGYLAVWHIGIALGAETPANFCGSLGKWTETDTAMRELVEGGFIEELPDLHCRYRIKAQAAGQVADWEAANQEAQALVILSQQTAAELREAISARKLVDDNPFTSQQHLELVYLMRIVSKFLKDRNDHNYPPALDARIDYALKQYAGLDESVKEAGKNLEREFKEVLDQEHDEDLRRIAKLFQKESPDA